MILDPPTCFSAYAWYRVCSIVAPFASVTSYFSAAYPTVSGKAGCRTTAEYEPSVPSNGSAFQVPPSSYDTHALAAVTGTGGAPSCVPARSRSVNGFPAGAELSGARSRSQCPFRTCIGSQPAAAGRAECTVQAEYDSVPTVQPGRPWVTSSSTRYVAGSAVPMSKYPTAYGPCATNCPSR